jgi:hypothetical protein
MGVRVAHPLAAGSRAVRWSLVALVLAGVGIAAATWVIVGSDGDPTQVVWPLVFAPVAICAMPVLVRHPSVRIGAAVALGAWCFVTGFSIGFTQLPALAAAFAATIREEP